MSMSALQARFIEEYLVDLNAAEAARRAGYSKRTACQKGYELLHMPKIQEAVTAAKQARSERTQVDQDWIIERLVENVERAMQLVSTTDRDGKPTGDRSSRPWSGALGRSTRPLARYARRWSGTPAIVGCSCFWPRDINRKWTY